MRPPLPNPRSAVMVNGVATSRGSSTAPSRCMAVTVPLTCTAPSITDGRGRRRRWCWSTVSGPATTWSLPPDRDRAPR